MRTRIDIEPFEDFHAELEVDTYAMGIIEGWSVIKVNGRRITAATERRIYRLLIACKIPVMDFIRADLGW